MCVNAVELGHVTYSCVISGTRGLPSYREATLNTRFGENGAVTIPVTYNNTVVSPATISPYVCLIDLDHAAEGRLGCQINARADYTILNRLAIQISLFT